MKAKKKDKTSIARINFLLVLLFLMLNDLDYFSTYLSILNWWIEVNPIINFMLNFPILFFIWKIVLLPFFVWFVGYENESKSFLWCLVGVNLVYFGVVWGNFGVVL